MKALLSYSIVVSLVTTSLSCQSEPTVKTGVESVTWLPSSATEISYSQSRGWEAYECKMAESDFVSWTKSNDLSPVEIVKPISVIRYSWLTADKSKDSSSIKHEISRGLHVQDISKGGAGYDLAYDRDLGKVYYHYQAH